MKIIKGSVYDCRQIAQVYSEAFPESVDLFFKSKSKTQLLDLLEHSFMLIFFWGGQAFIAQNEAGEVKGYCLYISKYLSREKRNYKALIRILPRFVGKISLKEISLLLRNKLALVKTRKGKHRTSAQIVSIAVVSSEQGKGLGRTLLESTLTQMDKETVGLNVRAQNISARSLYEKVGFRKFGSSTDLSGKWISMVKKP